MYRIAFYLIVFLIFPLFSSLALTEENEKEMDILLSAISVCSKEEPVKCASFVKRNLNKVKNDKIHNKLLFLYAESLFRLGNTKQLREVVSKINPQDLTSLEKKKFKLIQNYLLLLEKPEIALKEFERNWDTFIVVSPPEKIYVYTDKAIKLGKCELGFKFVSYLLSVYPDFILTPKSALHVAMCFYKKKDYETSFRLFYRVHLLYPTFRPNLVKMYLIHTSLLTGKRIKVVRNPEEFLFSLTLAPPSKDVFKVYLDYLTRHFKSLNRKLFFRGIETIHLAENFKLNLKNYVTTLFDKYTVYAHKKGRKKEIVYLFYNLKRTFRLNLKKLSKEGRSFLFSSLVDFLSYEDARRVKKSGEVVYSLIPNQTVKYYLFFNMKGAPKEALDSPHLDSVLKTVYLLKVERSIEKAKKCFFRALEERKELNSIPLYLSNFQDGKVIGFYSGMEKSEPTEKNYLNYVFYALLLYKNGNYSKLKGMKSVLYSLNLVGDEDSVSIVNYILFAERMKGKPIDINSVERWILKIKRELDLAAR